MQSLAMHGRTIRIIFKEENLESFSTDALALWKITGKKIIAPSSYFKTLLLFKKLIKTGYCNI